MKKYLLVIALLSPLVFMAQGKSFQLNKETPELINQYVVIERDSMTISDGYDKIIEWVNITYNTPKEVIKSQLKDEYIRIEGINQSMTSQKILGRKFSYKGKYSLTFEFKENKIKMELTNLQIYYEGTKYTTGGWMNDNPSLASQTKKNGKTKKGKARFNQGIIDSVNELRLSIQDYIDNKNKSIIKKNDW
ncbi:DUF4468 domain-containing protein [Tenacibaculum aquimarinum]|uniref:DUF4468 domain-containing protein n=1 Tax=Tenacibaculum aquimarinum TaxID=2910675 RepID=UPI001F0A3A9C|nr:DUF4468 domain-containing protein [Tenacibaculum aquimarinum]MCH3881181.1 DUF4468 domain-containing protein [Tenacibaculum aquimarinum]